MKIREAYCFDDVLLIPGYSNIKSRKEIDLHARFKNSRVKFKLPIISSPMDTVTESTMAIAMHKAGALGIIHRYNTIEEQAQLVRDVCKTRSWHSGLPSVGGAVGVSGDYLERAKALYKAGARYICVDIAHGHHNLMKTALKELRNVLGKHAHIMAGNVATLRAFNDLADWGADSIRVGVGGGSICSTRVRTGHGVPTFQSIADCAQSDRDATLIADGGIRNSGDIVKAYAVGADFVMLGSLLAGTEESPGDIIYKDGHAYKPYRGMASIEAQIDWRGHTSSVEGVSTTIPSKGPVEGILKSLEQGIRSGLSYSGAGSLTEFQACSSFVSQTFAGTVESSTHILNGN